MKKKSPSAKKLGYPSEGIGELLSLGKKAATLSVLRREKAAAKRSTRAILGSPSFLTRLTREGLETLNAELADAAHYAVRLYGPSQAWNTIKRRAALAWMAHRLRWRIADLSRGPGRPGKRSRGRVGGGIISREIAKAQRERLMALERHLPVLVHGAAIGLWAKDEGYGPDDYLRAKAAALEEDNQVTQGRVNKAVKLLLRESGLSEHYAQRLLKRYQRHRP